MPCVLLRNWEISAWVLGAHLPAKFEQRGCLGALVLLHFSGRSPCCPVGFFLHWGPWGRETSNIKYRPFNLRDRVPRLLLLVRVLVSFCRSNRAIGKMDILDEIRAMRVAKDHLYVPLNGEVLVLKIPERPRGFHAKIPRLVVIRRIATGANACGICVVSYDEPIVFVLSWIPNWRSANCIKYSEVHKSNLACV